MRKAKKTVYIPDRIVRAYNPQTGEIIEGPWDTGILEDLSRWVDEGQGFDVTVPYERRLNE